MYYDLTPNFFSILKIEQKSEISQENNNVVQQPMIIKMLQTYTQDILVMIDKVQLILRQSKEMYFANAAHNAKAFTNQQRQEFDNELKQNLEIIKSKIKQINQILQDKIFYHQPTLKAHFENVIHCLYQKQKKSEKQFREFLQFSKSMKLKLISMLELKPTIDQKDRKSQSVIIGSEQSPKRNIKPEFQQQNKMILKQNLEKVNQINETKQKIKQINEILDKMGNSILDQEQQSSNFIQIGEVGLVRIQKANENLVNAIQHSKAVGKYWIWFFNILTFLILFFDFIKR